MHTNYKIREMLSKVKGIFHDQSISYESIAKLTFNPEREIKLRAAEIIAREIAGQLLENGKWSWVREPLGEVIRVRGYWLDYESMYNLLQDAYNMGVMDTNKVGISFGEIK